MKTYSTSLANRKIQTKTTMSYHCTPINQVNYQIKKHLTISNAGRDAIKLDQVKITLRTMFLMSLKITRIIN